MSSPHHHSDQTQQTIMPQQDVIVHTLTLPNDICLVVIDHMEDTRDFRLLGPQAYLFVNKVERDKYLDAFYKHLAHSRDSRDLTRLTENRPELHLDFLIMSRHELFIQYHDSDTATLHKFVGHCRTLCEVVQLKGKNPVLTHICVNVNDLRVYKKLIDDHVRHGHTHHLKLVPQLGPDCADISQKGKQDVDKIYKDIIEPALQHSRQLILSHSHRRTSPTILPHHGGGDIKEGDVLAQCLIKFSQSGLQSQIHTLILEDYRSITKLLWLDRFLKLRVLSLRGASLKGAASKAFKNLHHLESLNLDKCNLKLKRIFWKELSLPVSLRQLSLEQNELTDTEEPSDENAVEHTRYLSHYLEKLINLESLNLKSNLITSLSDLHASLDKLAYINITYNPVYTDFSGITSFRRVRLLACTGTATASFQDSFGWTDSTPESSKTYEHIESFEFHATEEAYPDFKMLKHFTNLRTLDIAGVTNVTFDNENVDSTVKFSKMPHVHTLKLGKAKFWYEKEKLQGLKEKFPVLRHLDLHDCGLRMVHLVASELAGLKDLNLSDNPLTADHHDKSKCSQDIYDLLSAITTLETVHHASCGLVAPAKDFKSHVHFVEDDPGAHSRHT